MGNSRGIIESDGCLLADTYLGIKSSCFECPFDDCILYMGMQIFECWIRRKRAKELWDGGYTRGQIADELDVSRGTVNRYLRRENARERM